MGGPGSGRREDPVKRLLTLGEGNTLEGDTIYMPNLSGVKPEALKTSGADILGGGGGGGATALDELTDVTIVSAGNNELLQYSGSTVVNRTLSEAGVQAQDDQLDTIAGLTPASSLIIGDGLGDWTTVTPANFITDENILTTSNTKTVTNKTIVDFTNSVHADEVHTQIRNESGVTLQKGDPIYVSGYNAGQSLPLVGLADADDTAKLPSIGIVEETTIANNANGGIIELGVISGLDTSAFSVGDALYVSGAAAVGASLTNVKPTGLSNIQKVGLVLRSNPSNGIIEVIGAGRTNDLPNIGSGAMWIGNENGVPIAEKITGDVTITSSGATTISDGAVAVSNLASGTDGELITWDASGDPATVAVGTSGQVLTSNGAGAAPTFQAAAGGKVVQEVHVVSGAVFTGTTTMNRDDTIPQNTEGDEYLTQAITPTSSSNLLRIDVVLNISSSAANNQAIVALFQDSTADALHTCGGFETNGVPFNTLSFTHWMVAGTTSSTTFKVRAGFDLAGTTTINGQSSGRNFGGTFGSSITITEYEA